MISPLSFRLQFITVGSVRFIPEMLRLGINPSRALEG